MTRDEAIAATTPYHDLFYTIVHEAWAEWRAVQAFRVEKSMPPVMYKRVIANYVHDAIARRAIPAFTNQEKVNVHLEAQTFKLHFAGLCARFKKGDENNLGSNVPTQAALAFEEQDATLPGLPPETAKVDIIWRPNELWTDIANVLVVSRDGDELIWQHEVAAPASAPDKSAFKFGTDAEPDIDEELVKPKVAPVEKQKD
jgi:hypothetical protein